MGEEDEEDSAAAWVQKQKRLEEEKRLAELRVSLVFICLWGGTFLSCYIFQKRSPKVHH